MSDEKVTADLDRLRNATAQGSAYRTAAAIADLLASWQPEDTTEAELLAQIEREIASEKAGRGS